MLDFVLDSLDDELSKDILINRVKCFVTGDWSYLEKIAVTRDQNFISNKEFKLTDKEVFFDCGAFTGDTIKDFINKTKNRYSKIIAFEPDEKNCKKLIKLVDDEHLSNVQIIKAATGSEHTKVCFF